jgi:hypothetical protein
MSNRSFTSVVVALVAIGGVTLLVQEGRARTASGAPLESAKVWGAPPAEVFVEDYDGPPVTGDSVTLLPALAPLQPGNRTHHVRMDVVTAEIEVAPGVRFAAWTFGGTIPAPSSTCARVTGSSSP